MLNKNKKLYNKHAFTIEIVINAEFNDLLSFTLNIMTNGIKPYCKKETLVLTLSKTLVQETL